MTNRLYCIYLMGEAELLEDFVSNTANRPFIALKRASKSCRGPGDELDVVEGKKDNFLFFGVEAVSKVD